MPSQVDEPNSQFLERKLATILSADVAEFSRLMGENEEQTLKTFRGHKQVFESLVAMHRGRVFNTAGDAILAEFGSAVEAVRCATDIQAALRSLNDKLPPARQVRFRIGINLGDVMLHGQDLLGDGVNVAARLQTAAEPGGICIAGSVYDQIVNKLSLSFKSLGEMNFKNIPQPIRTFFITGSQGTGGLSSRKRTSAGRKWPIWIASGLVVLSAYWIYAVSTHSSWLKRLETGAAAVSAPSSSPQSISSLTRPGRIVVEHIGSNDPTREGFTSGRDLAPIDQQKQWGTMKLTPSQEPASWQIDNPVLGAVPYRCALRGGDRDEALRKGWRITLQARLLKLTDPFGNVHANFDTGVRRYDLNVIRAFPRLMERNRALLVRLNNQVLTKEAQVGQVVGSENPIEDGDRSHEYVLTYDPADDLARVYVDEKKLLEYKYQGHTNYTRGFPNFVFGASGAQATFELVRFEVFQ